MFEDFVDMLQESGRKGLLVRRSFLREAQGL
jgi:hypothetical protein